MIIENKNDLNYLIEQWVDVLNDSGWRRAIGYKKTDLGETVDNYYRPTKAYYCGKHSKPAHDYLEITDIDPKITKLDTHAFIIQCDHNDCDACIINPLKLGE